MTPNAKDDSDLTLISPLILEKMPVGVTVTDLEGHILYFNTFAAQILDRKPEYIGRDIRLCHKQTESIAKIDQLMNDFKEGRREEFNYEAIRNGRRLSVNFSVLKDDVGKPFACIQVVVVLKG